MSNTYLISYEKQTERSHSISDVQLGPKSACATFTFDARSGWRKFEEVLAVVTRKEAMAQFKNWKRYHKNSLSGEAYPPMRNPQLIEKTETVIAE